MVWFRSNRGRSRLRGETLPFFSDRLLDDSGHRCFAPLGRCAQAPRELCAQPNADSLLHIVWPMGVFLKRIAHEQPWQASETAVMAPEFCGTVFKRNQSYL